MTRPVGLSRGEWLSLGFVAVVASVLAVLVTEAIARTIWPEIALFEPLNSYARSVVFTVVPVSVATAVYFWLTRRSKRPERNFLIVAAIVLALSIIPDYALPVASKTVLASSVTAFLHVVAAVVTVTVLIYGHRRIRTSA